MGAEEVEEVGVEHLLRDIQRLGISGSLTHRVQNKLSSLKVRTAAKFPWRNSTARDVSIELSASLEPASNSSFIFSHLLPSSQGLHSHLSDVQEYLALVSDGKLPINHAILYHLQV